MSWFWNAITKKYAVFSGRARRREFWFYHLFYLLIFFVIVFVVAMATGVAQGLAGQTNYDSEWADALSGIWILAFFIPSLAVAIRRLHDIGLSGWWMLIAFIPILGNLTLLVMFLMDSQAGENKYGPNPKGVPAVIGAASP